MTVLLSLVNHDQAILVSDRRLTINGRLDEDESNKAGVLLCRDAELAFAYTGLAKADGFETKHWLAEALTACAPPDFHIEPLLHRFAERAAADFAKLRESRRDKRFTLLLSGYCYECDPPRAYTWRVSNFELAAEREPRLEASDEFTTTCWTEKRPRPECLCLITLAGARHRGGCRTTMRKNSTAWRRTSGFSGHTVCCG